MSWIRNGRPDFSQPGPARLLTGLVWGVALAWLNPFNAAEGWSHFDRLTHFTLLWVLLVAPFVLLAGLGHMRARSLAIWTLVAALLAAGLALHDLTRQADRSEGPAPSDTLVPLTALIFFVLHQWVSVADEAQRWVPPYDRLFGQASRQAVQLALSVIVTGLFWAVLGLGASLFGLIGLKGFGRFIAEPWFAFPATTLVFATAVHFSDLRASLIDGLKTFALGLLAWLGPLMTGLALAFLLSLPFVGLQPLWATKAATPILLAAAIVLIALVNAAYQDGQRQPPPALVLRLGGRIAALLLVPLVALAAYATALRIGQYGLTPERVVAAAVILVAGLAAIGYALAALSPGVWMKRLEATNLAGLVVAILTALTLLSPIADPARLSVDSQMARLAKGLTPPEKFDYKFLAYGGQRYGRAAMAALKARRDRVGELARASELPSKPLPVPEFTSSRYAAYPKGAVLPADFLATRWRTADKGAPVCDEPNGGMCDAFMIDLDGDGMKEILLQAPSSGALRPALQVFRRDDRGWHKASGGVATLCEEEVAALRAGGGTTAPNPFRDLIINGRHIGFSSERNCETPPPARRPKQADRDSWPIGR